MWAEIDIPEGDAALVAVGQRVSVWVESLEGRLFEGALVGVSPEVDPHTRTVRARALLANPDGALRANLLARARVATSRPRLSVLVPREAVQRAYGTRIVFVRLADDLYETRRVALGLAENGVVEVVAGVRPGERVVTEGSFLLKTETLKGSIGAGCCEVEPPSRPQD
jgi:cobalt-zinc-cadmium efflux system membrane fusion protein